MTAGAREQGRGVGGIGARAAAWSAWSVCGLTLALIACTFVLFSLNRHTAPLVSPYFLIAEALAALVGGLVTFRKPQNPVGWFIVGHALCFTLGEFTRQYAIYGVLTEPGSLPLAQAMASPPYWIWYPGIILVFSLLPLYFPNGRLVAPRWRPVVWLAVLAAVMMSGLAAIQPVDGETPGIPNPLGVEALQPSIDILGVVAPGLWLGLGVASTASLVVRYRRSQGEERQQIKWVVYAVVLMVASALLDTSLLDLPFVVSEVLFIGTFFGLWASIAVAILRYRLYDIDVLINRSLVYGALTVALALVYFGGVGVLQYVFQALSGQESQLAVVASTLTLAALFNPLRRRIQEFIDRRFYRKKYDAAKTLKAFSARLRNETGLKDLSEDLATVVRDTMQPEHVSLWLRPPELGGRGEERDR